MFKRQLRSSIGRMERATIGDVFKAADGIAVSSRNFSRSANSSADEHTSRKSRSAGAFEELASANPRAVSGVASSSLPTKPSSSNASRIVITKPNSELGRPSRNLLVARKSGPGRGASGKFGSPRRGGPESQRGRGMSPQWSRGGAGGGMARGGRARGSRGGRDLTRTSRKPRKKPWEDEEREPYTEDEIAYLDTRDGGFTTPYNPDTCVENLARHRPPVITNATGILDLIRYKLAVTTDNVSPQYRFSSQHLMRVDRGNGTIFEDPNQRALVQEQKDKLDRERADSKGIPYVREEFGILPKKTQEDIMMQWVAGHYEAPVPIEPGNPLTYIRNYAKRNETWLSQDAQRFEAKVLSLMP